LKKGQKLLFISVCFLLLSLTQNYSYYNNICASTLTENPVIPFNLSEFHSWEWSPALVVSSESDSKSLISDTVVDTSGSIHIVWSDHTDYKGAGVDWDIFYKRWDSTYRTWTDTELVSSESSVDSFHPAITVGLLGDVHIVWSEIYEILYKRLDATSSTWTLTQVVSSTTTNNEYSFNPSIGIDSTGNLHLIYSSNGSYIGYRQWNSETMIWSAEDILIPSGYPFYTSLAIDSANNVHIAYNLHSFNVYYTIRYTIDNSWSDQWVISTDYHASIAEPPSMAIDYQDNVHIVWSETRYDPGPDGDTDIRYKCKNSTTETWSTIEVVSTESNADSNNPKLTTDMVGNIHVVWSDSTNYAESGSDTDIFYKRRDVILNSWSTTEIVSTESTENSELPSISMDSSSNVHISWRDLTNYDESGTDWDIFYKQFVAPGIYPPELTSIVPNPSTTGIINLFWSKIWEATLYYVFCSSSHIWSTDGLTPIAITANSNYTDNIDEDGFYYYAIVAETLFGNTTRSNCEYVEVDIPKIASPELSFITPNPTDIANAYLDWNDIFDAEDYEIYRSSSYIWSVDGLTPIATVLTSEYTDSLPGEGFYFYVIVARNGSETSASNCQFIQYILPTLSEFSVVLALAGSISTLVFIVYLLRRKKS
jgi:hypothetical protein